MMKTSVLLSLFFLCIHSAIPEGSRGWIAARFTEKDSRFPTSQVVEKFDVRGLIGDFAFIVGYHSEIEELEKMSFDADYIRVYDYQEKLSVFQFNPSLASKVQKAFNNRQMQMGLIQDFFEFGVGMIESGLSFYNDGTINWDVEVETLDLLEERITPGISFEKSPSYAHLKKLTKNKIIEELLQQVSSDSLFSFDYHLSEGYFTRQSASEEIRLARDWLISTLKAFGMEVTVHPYRNDYGENVCGEIKGANPKTVVMAGAHYDSRSIDTNNPTLRAPGADDNGSGSSAMLEMARILSQSNVSLTYTARICFWTGEEQGLLGSDAYAKMAKSQGYDILAYFNADMLGYKLPNQPITLGMKDRSITQWLLDLSYEITAMYVPELPVKLSSSCCSDYISFFNQGYPSIGYFENGGAASNYPDYHTSNDKIANVNFEQMTLETRAVFAALLTFAEPY